jgi:hypothetical protein
MMHAESSFAVRFVALALPVVTGLYVVGVLLFGYAFVMTDWVVFGCIDGDEPVCKHLAPGESLEDRINDPPTLADIRTSSWILAGLALLCVVASGVVGLLVRRARYLAGVATLCLVAVVATSVLVSRV